MLNNYLSKVNCIRKVSVQGLLARGMYQFVGMRMCVKAMKGKCTCASCLNNRITISAYNNSNNPHLTTTLTHAFTTLSPSFSPSPTPTFIPSHYPTITLDLQQKLQKIESLLHSSERNLFRIVEEMIIVLEAFYQVNRRDMMEANVAKVIREFNGKLVGACVEITDGDGASVRPKVNRVQLSIEQQTDSTYELHQNYPTPQTTLQPQPPTPYPTPTFILHYLQTLKNWLITHIQTQAIITSALKQLEDFINAREVSLIRTMLQEVIDDLSEKYIEENDPTKREAYDWDRKVRGLAVVQFMDREQFEKYIDRLADDNLIMYLKQSQLVNLMYDVITLKPRLTNTQFLYQIQSTKVYQYLFNLNSSYIKAQFIDYSRQFMVSYQQIQFYELFKDLELKMKYPTIRTFIRLTKILKTEADDLHCQYNKVMNKYNYNILISIITSQQYNIENTRLEELLELFRSLNQLEKSGEILYDELTRYLKNYLVSGEGGNGQQLKLSEVELEQLYALFGHVLEQTTPVYKYEEKEGLNREFGKKTTYLVNVLMDLLIDTYPQVVVKGRRFMRNYLMMEEMASVFPLPCDDRVVCVGNQYSKNLQNRILKLRTAWSKVTSTDHLSTLQSYLLPSILTYINIHIHLVTHDNSPIQTLLQFHQQPATSTTFPQKFILFEVITTQSEVMQNVLIPLIKSFGVQHNAKHSIKQKKEMYGAVYKVLQCANILKDKAMVAKELEAVSVEVGGKKLRFVEALMENIMVLMKLRLGQVEKLEQRKRTQGIQFMQMSLPSYDSQLLLCLGQLLQLHSNMHPSTTQTHLSSSHSALSSPVALEHLPLIYSFVNTLGIRTFKSLSQHELIHTLTLLKTLEQLKTQNPSNILLLEITTQAYEYLYQSLSVFVMYLADRGKYYLKLNNENLECFIRVVENFVTMRDRFKVLPSKKRLVILQAILVVLVKKKCLKLGSAHLKRSQHAKIVLAFLDVFEYPHNLTLDFRKMIEEVQFLSGDLEQFPNQVLSKFSDINPSIARYLQDNKVNLTSSKQLTQLTVQQLKQQFAQGRSSMIYEMILRNSKYELPFELPEPKGDDPTAKLAYIIEVIYQKIAKVTSYAVPSSLGGRAKQGSWKRQVEGKRREQRVNMQGQAEGNGFGASQEFFVTEESFTESQPLNTTPTSSPSPLSLQLQRQKFYIRHHNLVNYIYQDHYKITSSRLPFHYKKQTWKNISTVPKQLQIQSLEIDQKIDQQIYKQVLLAMLGYVEKVKLVAKEFHSHTFIQYVAAQLDMEVMFHGCIARVARKNRPEETVLLVCAGDNSYKLLYVCTHILRESGENAYIVLDKVKESDFKDFLEKQLPQPFETEQEEIVDKVVKGEMVGEEQGAENGVIREDL